MLVIFWSFWNPIFSKNSIDLIKFGMIIDVGPEFYSASTPPLDMAYGSRLWTETVYIKNWDIFG